MQIIHTDRCGKCNRNGAVKLHCWSTTPTMLFILKVLWLYENTNSFYLKRGDGSEQEMKEMKHWRTNIFVLCI